MAIANNLNELQKQYKNLLEMDNGDVSITTTDGDEIMAHSCVLSCNKTFSSIVSHFKRVKLQYSTIAIKEFLAYIYYRKPFSIDETKINLFLDLYELARAYEYKVYAKYLLSDATKFIQKCKNMEHIIKISKYSNDRDAIPTTDAKAIQKSCEEKLNKIIKDNETNAIKTLYRLQKENNDDIAPICKTWLDKICAHSENKKDEKSNDTIDDDITNCCICEEAIKNPIALPCGHTRFCEDCVANLKVKVCPLCNKPYENIIKLFK